MARFGRRINAGFMVKSKKLRKIGAEDLRPLGDYESKKLKKELEELLR